MHITKDILSSLILERLKANSHKLDDEYQSSYSEIGYFICDDLLPSEIAMEIYKKFPANSDLTKNKSIRESKHVGSNVNDFDSIVTSAIYAFQSNEVVKAIGEIVRRRDIVPDPSLYAAGVSSMMNGDFLRPHLDNAMNSDRSLWRNFNLLYYLSPQWEESQGGHLELWPEGPGNKRIGITPKFNRLVLMHTHAKAWHSVSPIQSNTGRICISNYYFSKNKPSEDSKFRVTSFRDVNNRSTTDFLLKIDSGTRNLIRKIFKFGFFNKNHMYNKKNESEVKKD
jgi:Rps23 Pro-64 3,4-dihydroxylase Tpa1-like proline 4-hydroxylase